MTRGWYGRPVTAACVLGAVVAVALSFLPRVEWGQASGGNTGWDVIIEHFGVDSDEVEQSITRPLETEFARLEGVSALRSVSEYGKARVTVEVAEGTDHGTFFLALSDAVDRVSSDLPSSAQKPRIVPSSGGRSPAFIAALEGAPQSQDELGDWVERNVKPALEKRPGVGEVEVGGGQVREVHVVVNEGQMARLGLSFDVLAQAVRTQDGLLPAGTLIQNGTDRGLSVRGRLGDLTAVGDVRVGLPTGASVALSSLADVRYAGREADAVSRIDGDQRVVLLVRAAGAANLIAFSHEMASVLAELRAQGLGARVIVDEGKALEGMVGQTLRALVEGLGAALLVLPFLVPWGRRIAAIALVVPLALVVTTAVLATAGVTVDRFVLAGYAVGLGTVLDFGILTSRVDPEGLTNLLPSLGTGLATTLLFLVPLAFLDFVWPGIRTLVLAVGLLLVVSFALSALFLPVWRGSTELAPNRSLARCRRAVARRWARPTRRVLALLVRMSVHQPGIVLGASAAVVALGVGVVLWSGVNLGTPSQGHEVAVHVEFETEASLASVDQRSAQLVRQIHALAGVTTVQSMARPGSAELTVGWDEGRTRRADLTHALAAAGRTVPGAFVYLPEGSEPGTISVAVTLTGDDNDQLRSLAKQAAKTLVGAEGVGQVVLNFKDPPRRLAVRLDHAKAVRAGLSAAEVASALRWNLWGPVAVKWIDGDRERDLRVRGALGRTLTRNSLMNLPLVGPRGVVKLASVARLVEESGGAKIYHENRQRAVYLTVQTSLPARQIAAVVGSALGRVAWPSGYTFRIDPRLAEQQGHFAWVAAALVLSLVLIGLLLGARTQSFGAPPVTLAMVPVALAFPVFGAALAGGFTIPVLLSLVLLGGTVVNNAILIVDFFLTRPGTSVYGCLRRRLGPLAMTNATAVLGALPLALAGPGDGLLPTLAVLVVWGSFGAALTTVTTIPALLTAFSRALGPVSIAMPEVHR